VVGYVRASPRVPVNCCFRDLLMSMRGLAIRGSIYSPKLIDYSLPLANMLPISYFTPVHKARRNVNQGVNIMTKSNEIDEVDDVSFDNHVSEDENEDALTSEGEPVTVQSTPSNYADNPLASQTMSKAYDGSVTRSSNSKRSSSRNAVDTNLSSLRPPLLASRFHSSSGTRVGQLTNASGARQRHLAVLTAIMHRCLLQYDYVRAARAWSMILRSELDGHSVDLRHGCRWGLGAEILLQQSRQWTDVTVEVNSDASESSDDHLSPEGFNRLKEYYDRLCLQYPYHKLFPDAIGPLDFRSAMFGVWIYAYTNRTALGANIRAAVCESDHQGTNITTQEALRQAQRISKELVELVSSPPFSDSETFKNLKIMVDQWVADLAIANDGIGTSRTPDVASDTSNMYS
jgi:hypothetical protein